MESADKMRIPITMSGFHLKFAESATAQFNDTNL